MGADDRVPLLTFVVGQQTYALRIHNVVEVAAMVAIIPMPETPPGVLGVVNRHGEMLPLLDLRRVFGVERADISSSTLFVVTEQGGQRIGLVVDAVNMVQYVPMSAFQPVPDNRFIRAMVQAEVSVLQVIDPTSLFERVL